MAEIMSVRQFTASYRKLAPGTQVVVVDACRRKVLAAFQVIDKPETIERVIRQIFTN